MFYIQVTPQRIFFINEYYLAVPLAISMNLVGILIIKRNRLYSEKLKELEELKKQVRLLKRNQKIALISGVALGHTISILVARGGDNPIVNVDYINCGIGEGIHYLNNDRLRKIIIQLYSHKQQKGIIFITATAVCHLAKFYGMKFPALSIPIIDFGVTSYYQSMRKILVGLLFGVSGPLLYFFTPVTISSAILAVLLGAKLALTNLEYIDTSFITSLNDSKPPIQSFSKRINSPGFLDVIICNNKNNCQNSQMTMPKNDLYRAECFLAYQLLTNPKCTPVQTKPVQLPNKEPKLLLNNIKKEKVVTLTDTTGLTQTKFSDQCEVPGNSGKNGNLRGADK